MKFLHILFLFLLTTYIHTFEHSASEEWNDKLENALDRLLNLVGTVEQMGKCSYLSLISATRLSIVIFILNVQNLTSLGL